MYINARKSLSTRAEAVRTHPFYSFAIFTLRALENYVQNLSGKCINLVEILATPFSTSLNDTQTARHWVMTMFRLFKDPTHSEDPRV